MGEENRGQVSSGHFSTYPNQLRDLSQSMTSIVKLLLETTNVLAAVRREFRGESMLQTQSRIQWVQTSKPIFIKVVYSEKENRLVPLRKEVDYPSPIGKKLTYIPNDEAIEEIISMLKFAGINQITPITKIEGDNILDDLKEFECKLAAVLAQKQAVWGMDKELLPMIQFKIKTLVQDARFMCKDGAVLKALQTTVQRVESISENFNPKKPQPMYN